MLEGGTAWAWSGTRGPALEQNYWEAMNDRRATEEELAEAATAAAAGGGLAPGVAAPISAQWACLGCGQSKGEYKTCGNCKLAAYCSRECQQKHWPRHKPQCHQLVAVDKERQAKGAPKPAAPTPDPPLTLSRELIFSRDGYASLLEAHVANRAEHQRGGQQQLQRQSQEQAAENGVAANGCSRVGSASDDDKPGSGSRSAGADETDGIDELLAHGASVSPAAVSADSTSAEAAASSTGSESEGPTRAPDGSWRWVWTQPPNADLLTPSRPTGIFNTGNSCYAASAIQALLATPALGEWLRSGSHCTCCPARDDQEESSAVASGSVSSWCPACELSELAAEAAAAAAAAAAAGGRLKGLPATSSSPQPVNAGRLTKQVARLGQTLRPGRQEDAHELLMKLLEALAEIQVAGAGGRTVMREKARAAAKAAAAATAAAEGGCSSPAPPQPVWRGDETSLVHHCLAGYLRRATICNCCGHISQSHEAVLSLEVHLSTRVHSVEAGLKSYFEDEVLDEGNEYRCERCRQLVCATRRVRLEAAPNVLIIMLKRFTALHGGRAAKKDNKPVALKLRLDLAPHMAPEPLDDGPVTYRLYAVVQHTGVVAPGAFGGMLAGSAATSGTLNMGHYVAVVRGGDGKWYCCDDDEVTMVPESQVAAITDAYLLFYEREQPRLPPQPQPPAREDVPPEPSSVNGGGEGLGDEGQEQQPGVSQPWETLLSPNTATSPGWQHWLAPDIGPPSAAAAEVVAAVKARSGNKGKGQRKQPAGGGEAAEASSSASSQRAVVCPRYTLRPPRRQSDPKWELQVEMPGVRSRDVKLATTSSGAQQSQQQLLPSQAVEGTVGATASCLVQPVKARVRTWAAGWYNLDLELQLQGAPGPEGTGRWEVVVSQVATSDSTQASVAAANTQVLEQPGIEVEQPVWNNSRKVLKIPVRVLQ